MTLEIKINHLFLGKSEFSQDFTFSLSLPHVSIVVLVILVLNVFKPV